MLEESSGIKDWEAFRAGEKPVVAPNAEAYEWGTCLKQGPRTPTGKIELYSEVLAKYTVSHGLEPLPVYKDSADDADPAEYPFMMATGCRNHNAIHSRLHNCEWPRSLRPDAAVDINPADAKKLGIKQGDAVEVSTPVGAIRAAANVSLIANQGELLMFHGYKEANVNELIGADHLDPYSGFPGYKQFRCKLTKV